MQLKACDFSRRGQAKSLPCQHHANYNHTHNCLFLCQWFCLTTHLWLCRDTNLTKTAGLLVLSWHHQLFWREYGLYPTPQSLLLIFQEVLTIEIMPHHSHRISHKLLVNGTCDYSKSFIFVIPLGTHHLDSNLYLNPCNVQKQKRKMGQVVVEQTIRRVCLSRVRSWFNPRVP